MNRTIGILVVVAWMATGAWAEPPAEPVKPVDWGACMDFWYTTHVGVLPENPNERLLLWTLADQLDGQGVRLAAWHVPGHRAPEMTELRALNEPAIAWAARERARKAADVERWNSAEARILFVTMAREINELRRELKLPERDWAQYRERLQATAEELE